MNRTHPAPPEVQAEWRALGVWTDETLLDRLDSVNGATLAIVDADTRLTVADLRSRSAALAGALYEIGVRPGDVVAWQLPNWWEGVVLCWAVWRCGAVASPITPTLRAREVGFILAQTGARVAVVPRLFRGTDYPALVRDTGFTGVVVEVRGDAPLPTSDSGLLPARVAVDDPAVILWTSGTTSDPKGVVHTHQSLRVEAETIAAAHDMRAGESLLLPMPITHVAGLTYGVLLPVTSAITAVLMDTWEPARALELVEREHIAVMISTPVFMRTMIDDAAFAGTDTSSVRLFSLGGAGVAPAMVGRVLARSAAGASARTARPSTRRSPRDGSATIPNATRRPTAASSTGPSCASSTRRRSPTSGSASRASSSCAGPRCSRVTSIPHSTPTRSPTVDGSAPATSPVSPTITSRSSTA